METIGELLWQTTRGFQEASMLLEHIGRHMQESNGSVQADVFLAKARELSQQASQFQRIAVGNQNPNVANLQHPTRESDDSEAGE